MTAPQFPDTGLDLRYWLRHHPDLSTLHGGRVFFRLPDHKILYPSIECYRSGGGPELAEVPIDEARFGIHVWGGKQSDYRAVRVLVEQIKTAVHRFQNTVIRAPQYGKNDPRPSDDPGTYFQFAHITSDADGVDPDTGWPRVMLDLLVSARVPGPADPAPLVMT